MDTDKLRHFEAKYGCIFQGISLSERISINLFELISVHSVEELINYMS